MWYNGRQGQIYRLFTTGVGAKKHHLFTTTLSAQGVCICRVPRGTKKAPRVEGLIWSLFKGVQASL